MGKAVYQKLREYLDTARVEYREIIHAQGASAEDYHKALGCEYDQQLKCLLVKSYENTGERFVIVTVPALKRVDLEQIKETLHARKVRMASLEELTAQIGCVYGEVPPLAKVFGLQLLMDNSFLEQKETYMSAGMVDITFVISPQDLVRLEQPILI